jgi:hypothetical protein
MLRVGVPALVIVVLLAGCGSSSSGGSTPTPTASPTATSAAASGATADLCAARDGIRTQVDTLKQMTASTISLGAVRQSLTAIRADLTKASTAAKQLAGQAKTDAQAKLASFKQTVDSTGAELRSAGSISSAKATLTKAFDQMSSTFDGSLGQLSCG